MTPDQIKDLVGYFQSQLTKFLILTSSVLVLLANQDHLFSDRWTHIINVVCQVITAITAYNTRRFEPKDQYLLHRGDTGPQPAAKP